MTTTQEQARDPVLAQPPPAGQRKILFAKLGSFSYTNERLVAELGLRFPGHEIVTFDVKTYVKKELGATAWNALTEILTYGPSVLWNASDRHAFFFFTPFMFRHISNAIVKQFGPTAKEFAFVIQTQGLFNAKLPGVPLLIYTDYTIGNNADEPGWDPRLFRSRGFLRLEEALYRNADAVATAGRHVERVLVGRYGCDPRRVRTVHIGANVDIVAAPDDPDRYARQRILFVGVDWERKGGPAMIEAFAKVHPAFPDASLTIVGCSPAVAHHAVTVAGRVPRERMTGYFQQASIFCMPSVVEPLGIATIEASLYRLPVIATRIGGFLETVTDQETGILVPPNDVDALAEAMRRLLGDPALAARMGEAGFGRNRTLFDWQAVGKRIHDMVGAIAAGFADAA